MNWPIARRITAALILLTITSVIVVSSLGIARETEGIRNLSLATLRIIARKAAKSLDQLARTARAQTAALSNSISVMDLCRGKPATRVTRYFETRIQHDSDLARIMVVDANGKVRSSAPAGNPPGWQGVDDPQLKRALEGETTVTGMLRYGVRVTSPVRELDGTVIGAVMVDIDRAQFRAMLVDIRVGDAGFAIIEERMASGARVIVAHPNPELELRSRDPLTDAQMAEARSRWGREVELFKLDFWESDGDTFLTGRDGEDMYGASAETREFPWTLHVLLPRGEFDETTGELIKREIGTVIIVLLLACLVAWRQSRSILRPVRSLTIAAEKIAAGDLEARADIRSKDELGRLARVFDRMVPQLAETLQLKQSLAIAGKVQDELLPKESPQFDGLDVYGAARPYEQIGGDFFDFLDLRPWNDARLAVVVGDVVGHGIAAAMLMATARAHVRSRAQPMPDLGTLFNDINLRLGPDLGEEQFMTMALYVFDAERGRIDWCSAGHDAAFHYRSATDEVEERRLRNVPIGVIDDWTYTAGSRDDFDVGDTLLIGTDGIWEARNADGEEFGKERLRELLRKLHDQPSKAIVNAVFDAVTRFRGDLPRQDDLTLVAIRRT